MSRMNLRRGPNIKRPSQSVAGLGFGAPRLACRARGATEEANISNEAAPFVT